MCMKFSLYDAMIYVYTNALKDYATPMRKMMSLLNKAIRDVRSVRCFCILFHTDVLRAK